MTTKTLDNRGRIILGPRFANATVLVDDSDMTRIIITPAKVIPAHEAWLYSNKKAMDKVLAGIASARAGNLVDGPSLDDSWVADLED